MSAWLVYLATILDGLNNTAHVFVFLSAVCALVGTAFSLLMNSDGEHIERDSRLTVAQQEDGRPVLKDSYLLLLCLRKWGFIGIFLAVGISVFVPTTKQAAAIIGISYVSQIDGAEKLAPNALKSLNRLLEGYIEPVKEATE